jgi:threonine dehydrogenase-like Zn-dependent dehydrogenase
VKVLVAPELGRLEVGEADVPAIGPTQVLVRTVVSGVSAGTEKRKLFTPELGPNDVRAPWPAVGGFGYMAAGVVEAVGDEVGHVAPGDRVYCGRTWGGHREVIDTEGAAVVRLPDELGWVEAACSYWAVPPLLGLLAAEPRYFEDAAVVGLGPLGLMGVQHLARMARRVVALDVVAERRTLAVALGATAAVDPRAGGAGADRGAPAGTGGGTGAGGGGRAGGGSGALAGGSVVDAVRAVAPELPDVVLEVSGTQPGLETALAIVRPKGRVALVGSQQRLDRFDLFWPLQNSGARIVPLFREGPASVQSAAGSPTQRYVPMVHEMLLRGWLRIEPLITWVVSPEVAPHAMDLLHRRPDLAVGMAIAWEPTLVRDDEAVEQAWQADARAH